MGLSLGSRVPSKAATDILQRPDYPHGSTRRSTHSTAAVSARRMDLSSGASICRSRPWRLQQLERDGRRRSDLPPSPW